jgi:UDP-glucose 4-epimerase
MFFSSGGSVYGGSDMELVSEAEQCRPINLYGYSKLIFEEYIKYCHRTTKLDYLIIRPSNPYGLYQNPFGSQGFIAIAMNKLMNDHPIEIWGDGTVIRDYLLVTDMAKAIALLLLQNTWNTTFNVGSGRGYTLLEVLHIMELTVGKAAIVSHQKSRETDVNRIVLDISRLQKTVAFNPVSLQDGITTYYAGLLNR